jgi:hypothetical protein
VIKNHLLVRTEHCTFVHQCEGNGARTTKDSRVMRLDPSHRVIVALTGLAIGIRVLMPIHIPSRFGPQVDVAATLLQVIGILLIGAALFFIVPSTWGPVASRRIVGAGLILGWLLTALVFVLVTSKTGLVVSLDQTNWPLTTAAAVVLSLLSGLTWGVLRDRGAREGLRKGLAGSLLIILVGAGFSVVQQWQLRRLADLRQKQEDERRQSEALRTRIIEGEQLGSLHLGVSVDELRAKFQEPFSSVTRTRTGLLKYAWCCKGLEGVEADWLVLVDPKLGNSVGISLADLIEWDLSLFGTASKLPYETTKGVRFGHSPETVLSVYGPPSKTYTFDYGRTSLYYAPLRTEFEFVCTKDKLEQNTRCEDWRLRLYRITIFAPGWSPETLWGQGGRH